MSRVGALLVFLVMALVTLALATPVVRLERPEFVPEDEVRLTIESISRSRQVHDGWSVVGKPSRHAIITLTFALKQRNLDQLHTIFTEVSDPDHPNYGKFWEPSAIHKLVAPAKADVQLVQEWLSFRYRIKKEHQQLTLSRDFLVVNVTVAQAEKMLHTSFHTFQHTSGQKFYRALESYSLPFMIAKRVDFVGGVLRLPQIRTLKTKPIESDGSQAVVGSVTPALIMQWYNITALKTFSPMNSQSVSQFLNQYMDPSDLTTFQKKFNLLPIQPQIVGPNVASRPGTEASLDIEYIMGVAAGIKTYFIYTNGTTAGQEPFLNWIVALNNVTNEAPITNSVSYGDTEISLTADYMNRVNVEFQKFGATGHTLLFASGDSGVGCNQCQRFVPNFPASSPFVTAVGGTELTGSNSKTEVGVSFSGGGFSDTFAQPSYQAAAVAAYLASGVKLPAQSFWNKTSRAYPDISAFATNFEIVVHGLTTMVDGTSCAAPTAAAIISMINDLRLQNSMSPLGFLNPWLYSKAAATTGALYDVTIGQNSHTCCSGFLAAPGWDPVTGLGTLNYTMLVNLALSNN